MNFKELALHSASKFCESEDIPNLCVVGDTIVDIHSECGTSRIAQEAPIPVWKVSGDYVFPGGAAAVADFANYFCANVVFVSNLGDDCYSQTLKNNFANEGIEFAGSILENWSPETKNRFWIRSPGSVLQLSARIDIPGDETEFDQKCFLAVPDGFDADAVVVADYGKGFLVPSLLRIPDGVPVYVDPAPDLSGDLRQIYAGRTDWIVLNESEFERYRTEAPIDNVVRKRDRNGVVVTAGGSTVDFPAVNNCPRYVSGAGDMFIAAFATAHQCGLDAVEAAAVAHLAAGILIGSIPFDRPVIDRGAIYDFAESLADIS